MPIELTEKKPKSARPVRFVAKDEFGGSDLSETEVAWAKANGFSGEAGRTLDGELVVLFADTYPDGPPDRAV